MALLQVSASGIYISFGGVKLRFGLPEWMEEFANHPSICFFNCIAMAD